MTEDKCRSRCYDEAIVLLRTGLHILELYGLTWVDIDFEKRSLRVERQLTRNRLAGTPEYHIESLRRGLANAISLYVRNVFIEKHINVKGFRAKF